MVRDRTRKKLYEGWNTKQLLSLVSENIRQ